MNAETLLAVIDEAQRFLDVAKKVRIETVVGTHKMAGKKWEQVKEYTKESASCRRASMDLTRALAKLRGGI